ncbi:MAG: molybdenum cofactor biosynthesis protein MoaE [Ferrovum sp.]|nr:molybdenum cofactor biosynthesis protein MoaE [Ferrovum sp.]
MSCRLLDHSFNLVSILEEFLRSRGDGGAVSTFMGFVRPNGFQSKVESLWIEHYPQMTEDHLRVLEEEARTQWSLDQTLLVHRIGIIAVSEPIVLVATSSQHRQDARLACDYLVEQLKLNALFWKKEQGGNVDYWV